MLNWENFRTVPGLWADRVVSKENPPSSVGVARALAPAPSPEGVRTQLERILASSGFARSSRLTRFLRFSVEQVLCGKGELLKEQTIGIEVFDRKPDYDPRIDPIVRVEARRLRVKLKAYYTSRGRRDEVWIGLPKGGYAALFRSRRGAEEDHRLKPVPPAEEGRRLRPVPPAEEGHRLEPVPQSEKSIAVLPFANLTPDTGDDYFSDGLTEELIHLLTRVPHFRVVAWETTSKLRGREQDFAGVREQLEVGSILRGSVRRAEGRVRVRAQLIDAESGAYLWSEAYDRQMQDVFAIQEEIARAIVDTLQLTLQARQFRGGQPPGLKCYNLCLQGRFHANKRTGDGLCKSIACFEQAIAAEETCAVAYAGLADAFSLLADHGFLDPAEATRRARSAAEKALEIDPQCAEAHVSLAFLRSVFEWAWADAERLYRRAIVLNPGYSRAHHWFSLDHLAMLGRMDEALAEVRVAHSLDPLSQIIREGLGYVHMLRGEYPAALDAYRQLVDLDPAFYKGYSSMGRLLSLMGRYDEAIAALEKARSLAGDAPPILSALGQTLARAGRTSEALQLLDELRRMSKTGWVPSACFAILHLGLGDHEAALTHFEAAADARELAVTALKVHPMYAPLRGEPRFQALLGRIGR